jgi:hypothetical protein
MRLSGNYLTLCALVWSVTAFGQEVVVRGNFLQDSIRIGEPVPYAVSVRYPAEKNLVFPDSTSDFGIFEFAYRKYFPTETRSGISTDSAVYYITSFEVDSAQYFSFPVYEISGSDTIFHFSENADTIWMKEQVAYKTDTINAAELPLKLDTVYRNVNLLFNYPLWLTAGGITFAILLAVWIIFGKRIRQYILRRRLTKGFNKFIEAFNTRIEVLKATYSMSQAEQTVILWKKYLESLEGKPYLKFTSTEITAIPEHDQLGNALEKIDRMIYGGQQPQDLNPFFELKSFSEDRFFRKIENLSNRK